MSKADIHWRFMQDSSSISIIKPTCGCNRFGTLGCLTGNPAMVQDQLERVPEILLAIPEEQVRAMQIALSKVWHRFTYSSMPIFHKELLPRIEENRQAALDNPHHAHASLPAPQHSNLTTDDAFATIMQFLGARAALGLHRRPASATQDV